MTILSKRLVQSVAAFAFVIAAWPASASEVTLLSAMAFKATFAELKPAYEKATGNTLTVVLSGGPQVANQFEAGVKNDVAIMYAPDLDSLMAKGLMVKGSRVDIANSPVGVAVRRGYTRPDLSSADGVKKALLVAPRVALSPGASAIYMEKLFKKLGIDREVTPKIVVNAQGKREGSAAVLRRGTGDIGFQQVSEFVDEDGIDYVGPLPAEIQEITVFAAGISSKAANPDGAKDLLRYIASPAGAAILRKHGMDPAR